MQKAKTLSILDREGGPVRPRFFEERERSIDVRVNKIVRTADGAIHVAFGSEVYDRRGPVCIQGLPNLRAIRNICVNERIAPIGRHALKISEVSGVRQLVQINNAHRLILHLLQDEVRSDKARPAGDKNPIAHERLVDFFGDRSKSVPAQTNY
jgi:hypothetical protein